MACQKKVFNSIGRNTSPTLASDIETCSPVEVYRTISVKPRMSTCEPVCNMILFIFLCFDRQLYNRTDNPRCMYQAPIKLNVLIIPYTALGMKLISRRHQFVPRTRQQIAQVFHVLLILSPRDIEPVLPHETAPCSWADCRVYIPCQIGQTLSDY